VNRLTGEKGIAGGGLQTWHVHLLLGVLATGMYFLLPSQGAQHTFQFLFVLSALAAIVTGVRTHRPSQPLPWYLFACAMLMSILGFVTYGYYETDLGIESPLTTLADVFFIASYPCAAGGLLLIQSQRLVRDQGSTIDPIIVAVGAGMLAWVFLMKPYVEDQSLTLLEQLVSITYPLMDVLLLAFVVRLLLVPGRRPPAYYPLSVGLMLLLTFDAAYAATTLAGTYQTGSLLDALELLCYVLFGVAALHPSMADFSETVLHPETKLTRRRLALLAAASLMAPSVLALEAARNESIDVPMIVGGSGVLFLLVLARVAGIMRSREQAIDQERILRRTAAALVAAPDRESIYKVALDATRALVGKAPETQVAIATGSAEKVTVVAATDDPAGDAAGVRIYLDEYPDPVRAGLLEGRVVEAEHLPKEGEMEALLKFEPEAQTVFFVPLLVQAQLRGAVIVLTRFNPSEDRKAVLEALGREIALALESAALAEEAHRRKSEERFRSLIQNSSDVVAVVGTDGVTYYVSPAVERILGYKPQDALDHSVFTPPIMHPDDIERVRRVFGWLTGRPGASAKADFRLRHADGRWIHVETIAKNLLTDPSIGGIVVNYRDITERKSFEEQLRHQAFHDPLTDLPNRALFMDRLRHALVRMKRRKKPAAVLFLDLDNFKLVNDSLGHEAGDRLLVSVAQRLRGCLRTEDTAARFGGDEFTILLEDVRHAGDAVRVARQITRALNAPFALEGREVFINASIGIALSTSGSERPTDLLRNADAALYRAKASGKAACEVFDAATNTLTLERLDLEADLRRAIERGELAVHYQPQLELPTGRIVGWEALVRWKHPERGLLPPPAFLSVAEETGLITQIGNLVLEEACRQAKEWQEERHPTADTSLKISVNISARQLQHPDELVGEVVRVLEDTALAPDTLVLEITESMIMEGADYNVDVLGRLKDLGVRVAVDDFGTGYSNLAYLKRFPMDMVKIDKSFVDGLGEKPEDTAIVKAVISLARALGLRTVAEGIETTEQLERLRDLGCELGQGYYFSGALPAYEANALLLASAGHYVKGRS
jgi:diguanylate cyclase (GGDEF)-like protein/PAS domain S-box-containing protein